MLTFQLLSDTARFGSLRFRKMPGARRSLVSEGDSSGHRVPRR
jgi:hypothetical protein